MNADQIKIIEAAVAKKLNRINSIDQDFFDDTVGIAHAIGDLKKALKKLDKCLDQRHFEKAAQLGYSDLSSAFIFLQRCLGGLQDTANRKQTIVQDVCMELTKALDEVRYEDIAPFIEEKLESSKPRNKPKTIEISLGPKTLKKLKKLKKLRETPVDHLAEWILATTIKNDEEHWLSLESNKAPIPNIKQEKKSSYSMEEVHNHIEARSEQERAPR